MQVSPIKKKEDIQKMKDALSDKHRLLFVVGINTGLRISDLLKLTLKDLQGKEITLTETKTGKKRVCLINQSIKDELSRYLSLYETKPDQLLFPFCRQHVWRVLNQARLDIGLHDISIGTHTFRKTFGYHMYKNGISIQLIQKMLNHSSEKCTLIYIGIEKQNEDEAIEKLAL